jgi:futalosine hydrolase
MTVLEFKEGSGPDVGSTPARPMSSRRLQSPEFAIRPQPDAHSRMTRHLILIPTEPERRLLAPHLAALPPDDVAVELCGFGIVAAAARTAQLLAALRPEKVILVGIAGRLDDRLAIGAATLFDSVACHGIGVGSGPDFIPAGTLGWRQWPGNSGEPASAIGDVLPCAVPAGGNLPRERLLLTVTAAAAGPDDVSFRKAIYPEASAEEMEGFAVALACRLFRIPCTIVRGISNTAGDRDKAHWQMEAPLAAAADLVLRLLEGSR